jgi:outer membrane protein TolC
MARLLLSILLLLTTSVHAETSLTLDAALQRAMQTRGVDSAFDAGISRLSKPFGPVLPTVRLEAGAQRAQNVELAGDDLVRFDALTALVTVDYPLFEAASRQRRMAMAQTSARLFERRALDEADEVFHATLDAYVALFIAQQRGLLFDEALRQANLLRQRAGTMRDLGQITATTAATWEEQALAAESQRLDTELSRYDAETRLKHLIGDSSPETLVAVIDLSSEPAGQRPTFDFQAALAGDAAVNRATLVESQRQLALKELVGQRKPKFLVSAFGGIASVPDSFQSSGSGGSYGIYGARLSITFPSLDSAASSRLAEAELELEDAARTRAAAAAATRTHTSLLTLSRDASDKRLAILEKQIELAKARQQSMTRLVEAGLRTEGDLFAAILEVTRRETDLLALRAERWRLEQAARRQQQGMTASVGSTGDVTQ